MAAKGKSPSTTRAQILRVAGRLFGSCGVEAVGIRRIAREAGVNLASINYHFGSKEALFREICADHLSQINVRRHALLDAAVARGAKMSVEDVLEAFVRPSIEFAHSRDESNALLVQLFMQQIHSGDNALERVLIEAEQPAVRRFLAELARLLPEIPKRRLVAGFSHFAGSALHAIAHARVSSLIAGKELTTLSGAATVESLVSFGAGGLRALQSLSRK